MIVNMLMKEYSKLDQNMYFIDRCVAGLRIVQRASVCGEEMRTTLV